MNVRIMYLIAGIQFLIAIAMWYISLTGAVRYQGDWAVLLGVELLLSAFIILSGIRYFAGGSNGK